MSINACFVSFKLCTFRYTQMVSLSDESDNSDGMLSVSMIGAPGVIHSSTDSSMCLEVFDSKNWSQKIDARVSLINLILVLGLEMQDRLDKWFPTPLPQRLYDKWFPTDDDSEGNERLGLGYLCMYIQKYKALPSQDRQAPKSIQTRLARFLQNMTTPARLPRFLESEDFDYIPEHLLPHLWSSMKNWRTCTLLLRDGEERTRMEMFLRDVVEDEYIVKEEEVEDEDDELAERIKHSGSMSSGSD